ncbi:hypothetical protein EDB89DRAFT_1909951 [Lactarius sanguifluus]|nr:hypothetical protein EDB89DRAFT_1909951 [Lactarius sanguifluus]
MAPRFPCLVIASCYTWSGPGAEGGATYTTTGSSNDSKTTGDDDNATTTMTTPWMTRPQPRQPERATTTNIDDNSKSEQDNDANDNNNNTAAQRRANGNHIVLQQVLQVLASTHAQKRVNSYSRKCPGMSTRGPQTTTPAPARMATGKATTAIKAVMGSSIQLDNNYWHTQQQQ